MVPSGSGGWSVSTRATRPLTVSDRACDSKRIVVGADQRDDDGGRGRPGRHGGRHRPGLPAGEEPGQVRHEAVRRRWPLGAGCPARLRDSLQHLRPMVQVAKHYFDTKAIQEECTALGFMCDFHAVRDRVHTWTQPSILVIKDDNGLGGRTAPQSFRRSERLPQGSTARITSGPRPRRSLSISTRQGQGRLAEIRASHRRARQSVWPA